MASKLDNVIVATFCVFMGSCFTTSPDQTHHADKTFEQCINADEDRNMEDCDRLKCWNFWVKNFYKGSHRTPQLHAVERVYNLSLLCHDEDI